MHKDIEPTGSNRGKYSPGGRAGFSPSQAVAESPILLSEKLNVVVFAGGRGAAEILRAFSRHRQIRLTVLVNAYDDGLSTGAIRQLLPGMLGPSDVRKNISHLIDITDRSRKSLCFLIEYRFPKDMSNPAGERILRALASGEYETLPEDLLTHVQNLNLRQIKEMSGYAAQFYTYLQESPCGPAGLQFADCSLGNILLAGCYCQVGRNFNKAIETFSRFCEIEHQIANITDGENLVLTAIKKDGTVLLREAEIVSRQSESAIEDIFLLPDYLSAADASALEVLGTSEKLRFLRERERIPKVGAEAAAALKDADVIIYGPGTQHSSLFPSYLTESVGQLIAGNERAEKIFVANIAKDFEIEVETVSSLVTKLLYYLNGKGKLSFRPEAFVSKFFLQTSEMSRGSVERYLHFDRENFPFSYEHVVVKDWETQEGKHSGGQVLDEIISVVNRRLEKKLRPYPHQVSIVVPALNEVNSVAAVLKDLALLDIQSMGLGKEIIFVDGGSTDGTFEIASRVQGVECHKLPAEFGRGRGAAIRYGVSKARGSIVVTFPSDGEYVASDIIQMISAIAHGEYKVVFGSRATKCVNLSDRIRRIYKLSPFSYFVSKYGGITLSIVSLLVLNRYVSDVLTGVKAFDARFLKDLELNSNGVDLEAEIVAKVGRKETFILELPVEFYPRTVREGKKIRLWDGIRCLLSFFRFSLFTNVK